jgi:hypothetical protein
VAPGPGGVTLVVADHEARALEHDRVAELLFRADEDWAAVAYFYAGLHRVRAALLADPIFSDATALRAKHHMLTHRDRHCTKHTGHFRERNGVRIKVWGLNELVSVLYPQAAVPYEALYRASIDVRYERGLARTSLAALRGDAEQIRDAYTSGGLVA